MTAGRGRHDEYSDGRIGKEAKVTGKRKIIALSSCFIRVNFAFLERLPNIYLAKGESINNY